LLLKIGKDGKFSQKFVIHDKVIGKNKFNKILWFDKDMIALYNRSKTKLFKVVLEN